MCRKTWFSTGYRHFFAVFPAETYKKTQVSAYYNFSIIKPFRRNQCNSMLRFSFATAVTVTVVAIIETQKIPCFQINENRNILRFLSDLKASRMEN